MWRRFELGGLFGSSFEIAVEGSAIIVRIGSGTKRGRDQRRELGSEAEAAAEAARLVDRHVDKGYVEVPTVDTRDFAVFKSESERRGLEVAARIRAQREAAEALAARREAERQAAATAQLEQLRARTIYVTDARLEAECGANPDDPAPWAVYADLLLERGDPRGAMATDPTQRAHLLALHGPRLYGSEEAIDFEYRHGFAIGASMKNVDLAATTRGLLASPMGTFVRELRYGLSEFGKDNVWAPVVDAILASPRASNIRVLAFDDYEYEEMMMHYVNCGDFGDRFAKLPLEELRIRGDELALGTLPPTLRTFVREGCTTRAEEVAALSAREWPNLEHLEIWIGNRDYGGTAGVADLAPFLEARAAPRLTHLGIVNSELAEELVPALAKSKLLPQLESLDLSMGTFGGDAVRVLVEHAREFRHLASIDLQDNLLLPEDAERIHAVLDNVVFGPQRDDEYGRYVAEHE